MYSGFGRFISLLKNNFPIANLENTPLLLFDPQPPISKNEKTYQASQMAINTMLQNPKR